METCFKDTLTPYVAPFINLFLHGTVLAVILIVFFLMVIAPASANAMNSQFIDMATKNITPFLNNPKIAPYLSRIPYNSLMNYYHKPDPHASTHNTLLYSSSKIIITAIVLQLVVVILISKYVACYDYSFKHILVENASIFAIIGVVEFMFFKLIAMKYIPTKPSYISSVFIDRMILNLSK